MGELIGDRLSGCSDAFGIRTGGRRAGSVSPPVFTRTRREHGDTASSRGTDAAKGAGGSGLLDGQAVNVTVAALSEKRPSVLLAGTPRHKCASNGNQLGLLPLPPVQEAVADDIDAPGMDLYDDYESHRRKSCTSSPRGTGWHSWPWNRDGPTVTGTLTNTCMAARDGRLCGYGSAVRLLRAP
jgi:hypothetical protein